MMDFKPLWKILIDKEMSKKDLADMANITPATISRMKNKNNVSVITLMKISKAIDVPMDSLFTVLDE